MNEIKILDDNELERLRNFVSELSLMVGLLRGMIFEYQFSMGNYKKETLNDIDKKIDLMFSKPYFINKDIK